MSLSSEIVRCDLHRGTQKRASVSAVAHDAGRSFRKCASFLFVPVPTARFCANRGRFREFATRIFGTADTIGARWRGVSGRKLNFPRMGGASRHLHNAHFRKNCDAHFPKWELPEGHPARLGRIVELA
jgi:hypothetical protein